jgi:hypothetical protein
MTIRFTHQTTMDSKRNPSGGDAAAILRKRAERMRREALVTSTPRDIARMLKRADALEAQAQMGRRRGP